MVGEKEEEEEKEEKAELKVKLVAKLGLEEKSGRLKKFGASLGTYEDSSKGNVVCDRCEDLVNVQKYAKINLNSKMVQHQKEIKCTKASRRTPLATIQAPNCRPLTYVVRIVDDMASPDIQF